MWLCPLNNKPDCNQLHAINTADGCLKHYQAKMSEELAKLGWKRVDWPKRSYYWEEDRSHPSYIDREKIAMEEDGNLLKIEIL